MRAAGLDIGSRTVKVVLIEDGETSLIRTADTGFAPMQVCSALLEGLEYDRLVATGYGRHLYASHSRCEVVTEIKAVAMGARALVPTCRTVLDVGGQDTKVVSLAADGRHDKFTMNDRCAAGTGRFLEVMAGAMSLSLEELATVGSSAKRAEKLSSMCTVFAESEIISLVARGADRAEIALGIHEAIASRTLSLLKAVPIQRDVVFAGGGALNACLRQRLEAGLGEELRVPDHPQAVAALGCALLARLEESRPAAMEV